MGTGMKAFVGFVVMILVVAGVAISSIIGIYNSCVSQEAGLEAQYKQNQNNYDNFYKKVVETAGVTDRYAADFKKIYDGVMEGRYGEEGSKAMFQMLTEQNPQMDATLYRQVQQIIEAGRESFMTEQKTLLDKKRVYESYLNQIPSGPVAKFMGFPKKDISKFDIVTSDRTEKAFETKKDEPIDLKPKETTN